MRSMLFALTVLLVAACGGGDDLGPIAGGGAPTEAPPTVSGAPDQPPPASVEVGGARTWMAYGSYCWDRACVDMIPAEGRTDVPELAVAIGAEIAITLGFEPGDVRLTGPDAEHAHAGGDMTYSWTVGGHGMLHVVAKRPGGGDASYVVELVAP